MTKDAKTTFMDRLAVIGGTLGLFAGFSIISGIEVRLLSWDAAIFAPHQVIYFLVKIVFGMFEVPKNSKETSEGDEN